jgi:hypothetical protein
VAVAAVVAIQVVAVAAQALRVLMLHPATQVVTVV